MSLRSTRSVIEDLRANGRLIEVKDEVDPHLELAEIHRRVYRSGGPALLFSNVRGCKFPIATNLFGTLDRARFIFRKTFDAVQVAVQLKVDPSQAMRHWMRLPSLLKTAMSMRPKRVSRGPVQANTCQLSDLPHVTCWPDDGGAFVTLPQVLSIAPPTAGKRQSLSDINLACIEFS